MAVELMALVWRSDYAKESKDEKGKPSRSLSKLLVMLKLADSANDEGICYPKQVTLAKLCGISRQEVNKIIKELERDAKLVIDKNRKLNHYQLLFRDLDRCVASGDTTIEPSEESSGASQKQTRQRDPRLDALIIQAVRELMNRYPDKILWDRLITRFGDGFDKDLLAECRVAWVERGYNPNATTWLNWYFDGIPERKISDQSYASRQDDEPKREKSLREQHAQKRSQST